MPRRAPRGVSTSVPRPRGGHGDDPSLRYTLGVHLVRCQDDQRPGDGHTHSLSAASVAQKCGRPSIPNQTPSARAQPSGACKNGLVPLSGQTAKLLSDALRSAFLPPRLDELLLFALDRHRHDITLANDYQSVVYDIIRTAKAEGWLAELVAAAREARPSNVDLHAVAAELGLASATPSSLERLLRDYVPDIDVTLWRERLARLEFQVCRIEVAAHGNATLGTGFLVSPDACMTNYHVVEKVVHGRVTPNQVVLRFDYRRTADGSMVKLGTEYGLQAHWLIDASPPSKADLATGGSEPTGDELDFAILRVAGSPGLQPIGSNQPPNSQQRGWLCETADPVADSPLCLLQHPSGEPLKLSFGSILTINSGRTRLRHSVNTQGGSSGSPCFNAALELVALHHAGDPDCRVDYRPTYNAAIPIGSIRSALKVRGTDAGLFALSA